MLLNYLNSSSAPSIGSCRMNGEAYHSSRILIVDDDAGMRQMLADYLVGQNMAVACAAGRQDMEQHFASRTHDLVILDLRLDHDDGLDLLRNIRQRSDIPVIITTGHRKEEIDRVVGLELGADDYMTKRSACGSCWLACVRYCAGRRRAAGWPEAPKRPRDFASPDGSLTSVAASCVIHRGTACR